MFCRKFGPSKRFSEADKREVSDLIAVKLQLSQDDWRRETEKVKTELERLTNEIQERDDRLALRCLYIYNTIYNTYRHTVSAARLSGLLFCT